MSESLFKRAANEWRLDSIGIAVFIVLTGLAYLLEFEPALRDRDSLRVESAELADKRETISKLQATLHNINDQIAALEVASARELKLRPPSDVNDRLSDLASLAGDEGLQVEAMEPGEAASSVRYSTVPIRIGGRGSFTQFATFIRTLHTKLPDTSVTDMSINGGGTGAAVSFTIILQWYAAPAPIVAKTEMQ